MITRKNLKLILSTCVLTTTFIFTSLETQAAVKLEHPEVVTHAKNSSALKKAKDDGVDFSTSPVKPENLTTENYRNPQKSEAIIQAKLSELMASGKTLEEAQKALSVVYNIDRLYTLVVQEIQNNWLVPLNFVALDNGIPLESVWYQISSSYAQFRFDINYVTDLKYGGVGDGGYYWRRFRIRVDGVPYYYYKDIWLSAYDLDHLVYGI